MKLLKTLATFASVVLVAAHSPVPIDSRNLSEIYAAAQKECGVLHVVYGGDEHNQADAISNAFLAQFPNLRVNFTVDLSKYLDGKINKALFQNKLYADVAIIQTLQDFDDWKERGLLLNYKPPSFDKLWTSLTDVDGAYIPVYGGKYLLHSSGALDSSQILRLTYYRELAHFGPFVFNSSVIPAEDIPKSYADILDSKWKGKIVLTYPNDDDAVLYLFTLIIQQYGWQWLDRLLEQDVQWVRGTASPAEVMLLNTNKTISFTTFPPRAGWGYVPPVSDRYMSWAQSSSIFKDTKLPETAKLVQAFLISEAGQSVYLQEGLPSVRKDLVSGNETIWDLSNTDYVIFHQFMENRETVEAWRFAFEDKIGTAQGLSPLIDDLFVV
ncbi:hypothetical protein V1515DRAFT_577755 [Lipomyces mesembrius]